MTDFTPWQSLFGGGLIGLAVVALMAAHGRIAGMTGIIEGLILSGRPGQGWRAGFLAGAIVAPALLVGAGAPIAFDSTAGAAALIFSGLVVGIGVAFGGGCTSGHGICGMARLSSRSIVATLVFMVTTGLTVFVIRHVIGGF